MKWLLHSFLILICFLIPAYANAHTGTLEGIITDNITNHPVEGVPVLLKDEHLQATSDANGKFIFENIPTKAYSLVFQKEEYLLRETRISLA